MIPPPHCFPSHHKPRDTSAACPEPTQRPPFPDPGPRHRRNRALSAAGEQAAPPQLFAAVEPRAALTLGPALQHRQDSIRGAWTPKGALHRPGPELRPSAAHDLRRRRPSAATPAIPRLGKSQPVSRMLLHHSLYHVGHPSSGNTPAGEAPPRRAAVVLAGAAQSPTQPRNCLRWFTHVA